MKEKATKGRFPRRGETGSYEWHYKQYYSSVEPEGPRGRIHIQSPSLSFKTDKDPMVVLRGVLHILDNRGFTMVLVFNGLPVGLPGKGRETILTSDLVFALEGAEGRPPLIRGFQCEMAHDKEDDLMAKLRVGRTRSRLKIRGAIQRAAWDRIRKDIRRKLHLHA